MQRARLAAVVGLSVALGCSNGVSASSTASARTRASVGAVGSASGASATSGSASGGTAGNMNFSSSGRSSGGTGSSGGTTGGKACNVCGQPFPICGVKGICVECTSDAQCPTAATPHCVTDSSSANYGSCEGCLDSAQCNGGLCNPLSFICQATCAGNPQVCAGPTPHCEPDAGLCVACLGPSDCALAGQICVNGACGPCQSNSDCGQIPGAPFCILEGLCVQCLSNADCDGGSCQGGACH